MSAVGQQVIFGIAVNDLGQTLSEFAAQEAHDLAYALQGESLASQFADDRNLRELIQRIQSPPTCFGWLHHAALVPPLKLTRGDAGQVDHVPGCEAFFHSTV